MILNGFHQRQQSWYCPSSLLKKILCGTVTVISIFGGFIIYTNTITIKQHKQRQLLNLDETLNYLNQNRTNDPLKLVRSLGYGIGGHVYEIRNQNQSYALKIFKAKSDCAKEANIMKHLSDIANVPQIYENMCESSRSIRMDLIEGKNLRSAQFEYAEAWKVIYAILTELRKKGIYHRDIHSGNIMKTKNGDFWIIDFSLAIQLDSNQTETLRARKLFEKDAYAAQSLLFHKSLSWRQIKEIHSAEEGAPRWEKLAEAARNSSVYNEAHRDHEEEKYLTRRYEQLES